MGLPYDPNMGCLRTAIAVSHSVLPHVFRGMEFWLFMFIHLVLYFSYRSGILNPQWTKVTEDWGLNWQAVRIVTTITTFFEVFYFNQCFARYTNLYNKTRCLMCDTCTFAMVIRTFHGEAAQQHCRATVRCVLASVLAHLHSVGGGDSDRSLLEIQRLGVLKQWEVMGLSHHSGANRPMILLQWAGLIMAKGDKLAKTNAVRQMTQLVMKIRSVQQETSDILGLQVPYPYYHLLNSMVCMNLIMWAYVMALTDSVFAPMVFGCCMLIFLGMMTLADEMCNPFGSDAVDFTAIAWGSDLIDSVANVCELNFPSIGGQCSGESPNSAMSTRRSGMDKNQTTFIEDFAEVDE